MRVNRSPIDDGLIAWHTASEDLAGVVGRRVKNAPDTMRLDLFSFHAEKYSGKRESEDALFLRDEAPASKMINVQYPVASSSHNRNEEKNSALVAVHVKISSHRSDSRKTNVSRRDCGRKLRALLPSGSFSE